MHEMQTSVIRDPVAWASVSLSVTRASCAKTAVRIEVLLGIETLGDPRNPVLDVVLILHSERAGVRYGLFQITLATG